METVNLNKKVFAKNQYEKVIDTKFSQLATTITPAEQAALTSPTITVDEFFQNYAQLFLQIPKEGETNSHEYLIKTSSEYINFTPISDDIQALIDEINLLQQQNLELNQQIIELTIPETSGSINSLSTQDNSLSISQRSERNEVLRATRGRG
jgi:hypothetical protein